MRTSTRTIRRAALALGTLALVAGGTAAARPLAHAARATVVEAPPDEWLKRLDGSHRQLFDAPEANGGVPLVHVMNYYDTYNRAYGVPDSDIDAVFALYGGTTLYAVNDAAWAKYRIGEFLQANDAAGTPATANPWRHDPTILGMQLPQASIEGLQKRGATFIVCDNALTFFAGALAKAQGADAAAVHADLKANLLPGVELIPGMVVAIEQAHRAGLSYHRQ